MVYFESGKTTNLVKIILAVCLLFFIYLSRQVIFVQTFLCESLTSFSLSKPTLAILAKSRVKTSRPVTDLTQPLLSAICRSQLIATAVDQENCEIYSQVPCSAGRGADTASTDLSRRKDQRPFVPLRDQLNIGSYLDTSRLSDLNQMYLEWEKNYKYLTYQLGVSFHFGFARKPKNTLKHV